MSDEHQRDEDEERGRASVDARAPEEPATSEDRLIDLFLEDDDKRPRQYAIIITCVIFIVLFLVALPKGRTPEFDEPIYYVPDLETFIPPMKDQPKVERKELEQVKKVPLPDPTPEEPEPVREPTPEPEPEPLPLNAKVLRGLPKGPPMRGGPVREGMAGLTNPVVVKDVEPEYPLIARRAGVGGQVVIRAIIDRQGDVTSAELLKGLGQFGLDEAALEAVKQRKYKPGLLEGKPVEVIMTIRVNYIVQK